MSGTPRRHAEELFQQVADLPRHRRADYLDRHTDGDPDLRRAVERLLVNLENGQVAALAEVEHLDAIDTGFAGQSVGPYELIQVIGEGGFGVVYMARQVEPVRRTVALKIIKLGMDTKQVIARFEAERQALAMMEHPGIARVFDAGATETGRPYFVMELVDGTPITEFCDAQRLVVRERLSLLSSVCRAVQHAHQKGVIHRDIKPSNLLVELRDGAPAPKVIDFGIAKATSERLTDKPLYTDLLQFIGTPQYMSPEQAQMNGRGIDTRSDVYSLGAVLYELLTGVTPVDSATLQQAGIADIQRLIQENQPQTPSHRIAAMGEDSAETSRLRRSDPAALKRTLRGDLDWIVVKALEKDPTHRYDSAASLADDIDRHLRNDPVMAASPGAAYRFRKFVRRNRAGVGVGAIAAAAMVVGLAAATVGLIRARAEAESAKAINAFFSNMLISADPLQLRLQSAYAPDVPLPPGLAGGFARDVSVAEMAHGASERIEAAFAGKEKLAATAYETIGMTLRGLGHYAQAEPQLRSALEIRARALGGGHPDTLRSRLAVGDLLVASGRPKEGEPLVRSACDGMARVFGEWHPKTLSCASALAGALTDCGEFQESEDVFARTLRDQRRTLGNDHRDTLATMWKWSVSCLLRGEHARGQALAQELREISRRTLSPDDSLNVLSEPLRGWWFVMRYQYDEAVAILRPGLVQCRRILGQEHPFTFLTMQGLARALQGAALQDEKERLYREALAGLQRTRGELHWQTVSAAYDFAGYLSDRGLFDEAERVYRKLVEESADTLGADVDHVLVTAESLAHFLQRMGKLDESIAVSRRRLQIIREEVGPESPVFHREMDALAKTLLRMGRLNEGRQMTQELISLLRGLVAAHEDRAEPINALAWILLTCEPPDLRHVDEALPLAARAVELSRDASPAVLDTLAMAHHLTGDNDRAVEIQQKALMTLPPNSERHVRFNAVLVRYLTAQGDSASAATSARRGAAQYRTAMGEDNPRLAARFHYAGTALARAGHLEPAEALLREGLALYRGLLGPAHEQVAACLVDLADVLAAKGEYRQAATTYQTALHQRVGLLGDRHLQVAQTRHSLGLALHAVGDLSGAAEMLEHALEAYRELGATAIPEASRLERHLADVLLALDRIEEADPPARSALRRLQELFGEKHLPTAMAMATCGLLLIEQGETLPAEELLRRSLSIMRELSWQQRQTWRIAEVESTLGYCLIAANRFEEAEELLLRSHEAIRAADDATAIVSRVVSRRLAALYEAWGKPERASHWRLKTGAADPPANEPLQTGVRSD